MDKANVLCFTSRRTKEATKAFVNLGELQNFLKGYENGNSRLYKASIDVKQ